VFTSEASVGKLAAGQTIVFRLKFHLRKQRRTFRRLRKMATLQEITAVMAGAVGEDSGLGKTLKFDFKGDGFIHIDGGSVTNDDKPADCTIVIAFDDFQSMADGKLDPTMAFMQGKIKVNGDMSVAMKLQPIMAKARG
jgi:putative sterol carrier protein